MCPLARNRLSRPDTTSRLVGARREVVGQAGAVLSRLAQIIGQTE